MNLLQGIRGGLKAESCTIQDKNVRLRNAIYLRRLKTLFEGYRPTDPREPAVLGVAICVATKHPGTISAAAHPRAVTS